jgi:exopolyphosphatase/guanosine-5'-triphosphate,3'-diphosphate pyrophosphatase
VFGERLGPGEARLAARTPERVEESDDLYLLSPVDDVTVKIRGGVLDIKRRVQVDDDGLEQWEPIAKSEFPLAASDAARAFAVVAIPFRPQTNTVYELDRFVRELARPPFPLQTVRVRKRRAHHTLDGCMAELSEVDANGLRTRTIALESEDPGRLIAAVRNLGFDSPPNVSYPRALKALLGIKPRCCAVIDVGTNSVKLHIAEPQPDGTWRTVADRAEVTRLGEGLEDTGEFRAEAMDRTSLAIAGMVEEAGREGVAAIAAAGTAGMRIARNSGTLIESVRARCGIAIEVIGGEDEARLAYLAVKSGLNLGQGSLVVFDTGGGSSQFTFGHGGRVDERFSVDVGAARFADRYGLAGVVSRKHLRRALDAIAADLARLDGRPAPDALVGMGGAVTNLTAVARHLATYDPDIVQGATLDRDEVDRQIERYRTRTVERRREIVGLQPARAEVILAGACIVRTVMEKLGKDALTVSDRGLRHGLLVERFGTWTRRVP